MNFIPFREAFQKWKASLLLPPRSFLHEHYRAVARLQGKHHKGVCWFCGGELPPRKRRWCGKKCVKAYNLLIHQPDTVRNYILKRDKGVCADCGLDCIALHNRVSSMPLKDIKAWMLENRALLRQYKKAGLVRHQRFWDIDHIIPVCKGGGLCSMSNLQTLCVACHRRKTRLDLEPKLGQAEQGPPVIT